MKLDPRTHFLKHHGEAAGRLADIINQEWFRTAVQAALLHYSGVIPRGTDPQKCLTGLNKLEGAQEFANILLTFTEEELAPQKPPAKDLSYTLQ